MLLKRLTRSRRGAFLSSGALGLVVALHAAPAHAACALRAVTGDVEHRVLDCGDGVTIHAAADAAFSEIAPPGDARASGIALEKGAVSVEFHPGAAHRGFEVRAPRAIAAVRGTKWVVETDSAKTSIFVLSGEVAVTETALGKTRLLRPGQGLDISDRTDFDGPQIWPKERVDELMSRVGG